MTQTKTEAENKRRTKQPPDLYLCVDCGGSATKILYQSSKSSQPSFLVMSPEVEKIEPDWLANYLKLEGSLISPAPEQEAYLEWNDQLFAVGHFANRFSPEDRIGEAKYENASYKVVAAVGAILQKEKLPSEKINRIKLAILLPWNEYSDAKILEGRLDEMFSNFKFRQRKWRVKLEKFVCRPEGFGLAMIRMRQNIEEFKTANKAVLMLGHRNSTALIFEKGALRGDSPLYGFRELLDLVVKRTSGLERDALAMAIFGAIKEASKTTQRGARFNSQRPDFAETKAFQVLARAKDPVLRVKELVNIAQALEAVSKEK